MRTLLLAVALFCATSLTYATDACMRYADAQIVGKFSTDTAATIESNATGLQLLLDSLSIADCDANVSKTSPSVSPLVHKRIPLLVGHNKLTPLSLAQQVLCGSTCLWESSCEMSSFDALKSAVEGKKIVFTGGVRLLGGTFNQTFTCETADTVSSTGFSEIALNVFLPCEEKENARDTWKFVTFSLSVDIR